MFIFNIFCIKVCIVFLNVQSEVYNPRSLFFSARQEVDPMKSSNINDWLFL